jgi:MFS family permease
MTGGERSIKEALRTSQYWLLFSGYSFQGIPINGLLAHLVIWGVDLGSSKEAAGIFIAALTLAMATSAPIGGLLGDRYGKKPSILTSNLCCLLVMLLAWQRIQTPHQLIVFALAIGFCLNLQIGLYGPLLGDLFGRANIGFLYGTLTTGWGLIGGTGALLWGLIFDLTGNYNLICLVSAICYGITCITILFIRPLTGKCPADS